ncbi:MAG: hypothetical protein HY821_14880 [Acidobacteria bacterium]|nr:hypothetical protein [Acidobacteriota bacterium]
MIRRFVLAAAVAALAVPAIWAQRAERAERSKAILDARTEPGTFTPDARAMVRAAARQAGSSSRAAAAADKSYSALPMAGGVTQVNLFDTGREAYFVLTEVMPAGSTVQAYIMLPKKNQNDPAVELPLEARNVIEDLPVGYSFYLTGIKTLGDFWPKGITTYYVVVTKPSGEKTMSATDFSARGYFRDIVDTSYVIPGINWYRQFVQDGSVFVEIKGRFLSSKLAYVVFEDIVAPQDAIKVVDDSTIVVNLSKVPNFDTTLMKGYLLTVGQDSWTDTYPFRYTPI